MRNFAISFDYICTANPDGSIPLNARIAASIGSADAHEVAAELVSQANAAIDLLFALKGFVAAVQEGHIVARDPDFIEGRPYAYVVRVALAAIAKAEGKS